MYAIYGHLIWEMWKPTNLVRPAIVRDKQSLVECNSLCNKAIYLKKERFMNIRFNVFKYEDVTNPLSY